MSGLTVVMRSAIAVALITTCAASRTPTPIKQDLAAAPSDVLHLRSNSEMLPDDAVLSSVPGAAHGQNSDAAPMSKIASDPELLLFHGIGALMYFVAFLAGLMAAGLLACCLYELGRYWCHCSHFRACERKLRRVHEAFLKERTEFPLCPFCVEPIVKQASPTKVVFLCGHRFHIRCANAWFRDNPANATKCPICVDPAEVGTTLHKCCTSNVPCQTTGLTDRELAASDGGFADEAQNFILKSLHRSYPEFIAEEHVRRWGNCSTELWLQELICPRYNSVMKKYLGGKEDCGEDADADADAKTQMH